MRSCITFSAPEITATRMRGSSAAVNIVIRPPYDNPDATQPLRIDPPVFSEHFERPSAITQILSNQQLAQELKSNKRVRTRILAFIAIPIP
jgi:hypothetical protein